MSSLITINGGDGNNGFVLLGIVSNDNSGYSVSTAGDINSDGFSDLIIGAPFLLTDTGDPPGESFVIFGRDFRNELSLGSTAGSDILLVTESVEILIGGLGNDTLGNDSFNGGDGNDKLEGDSADDVFLFDTTLGASNIDNITDFDNPGSTAGDVIHLDNTIFTALGSTEAALTPSEFLISSTVDGTAGTTATRIIYDSTSGGLYYDANGSNSDGVQQFATLLPGLAITEDDFFVIS